MEPFNLAFNVAINHIASRLFPCGFDVVPESEAPDCLEKLNERIASTGRMAVMRDYVNGNIYGCNETNWAFRAWHDWCHWKGQHAFDLDGEAAAARMQIEHVRQLYGEGETLEAFSQLIMAEIVGTAAFFAATGDYPKDQRAFVREFLRYPVRTTKGAVMHASVIADAAFA